MSVFEPVMIEFELGVDVLTTPGSARRIVTGLAAVLEAASRVGHRDPEEPLRAQAHLPFESMLPPERERYTEQHLALWLPAVAEGRL